MGASRRVLLLATLAVQHTQHALLLSYARQTKPPHFTVTVLVAVAEIVKVVCNLTGLLAVDKFPTSHITSMMRNWRSHTLRFAFPAFCYTLSNNCQMLGAAYLTPIVYQIVNQLRIPLTAFLWQCFLQRSISRIRWFAVFALTFGVLLVVVVPEPVESKRIDHHHSNKNKFVLGLLLVSLGTCAATLASVWFEWLMKVRADFNNHKALTVFESNLYLSAFSFPLSLLAIVLHDRERVLTKGPFWGFGWLGIGVLFSHAIGGLLVSFTLKFATNVLKTFATAASLVLTCLLSALFYNKKLSLQFTIGVFIVILATLLYSFEPQILASRDEYEHIQNDSIENGRRRRSEKTQLPAVEGGGDAG